MKVEATYRQIWRIAYPIMLGGVAQTALNVTDTAFLARVGETELAASAIGGVFYFVLVMIGVAIAVGLQILISRNAGEGNLAGIAKSFDNGLLILIALSVLMFIASVLWVPWFYNLIIHETDVKNAAVVFVHYRAYGLLLTVPALAIRSFFTGISQTRIITLHAVISAVLNIILDYILIFGHLGFEPMGIKGAGIATAIAEIVSGLFVFAYMAFYHHIKEYHLFKFNTIAVDEIKRILNVSAPIVLQNFLSMGAWFVFFIFIEKLGKHELAISNVIRATYMILMTPVFGFSNATNSMVSNLIGQKKHGDVFILIKKVIIMSLLLIGAMVLLCSLFPYYILALTAADDILINDAMMSYYIVCASTLILAVSINLLSAVSGTGATKAAMYIEVFNIAVYMLYIYFCCIVFKTSIEIVWLSEGLYWAIMGLLSYLYLRSGKWKHITV